MEIFNDRHLARATEAKAFKRREEFRKRPDPSDSLRWIVGKNVSRDFYPEPMRQRGPNCSIVRLEWLRYCRKVAAVRSLLNRNYASHGKPRKRREGRGAHFLEFRSKTDPSSGRQWAQNESTLGLPLSAILLLLIPILPFLFGSAGASTEIAVLSRA